MTERPAGKRPSLALAMGTVVVVLAAARIPLLAADHQDSLASTIQALAIAVPFAAIGVLVARRRPDNASGWLIVTPALFFLLGTDVGLYAAIRYRLGHSGLPAGPAALLLYQAWLPVAALFPLVILPVIVSNRIKVDASGQLQVFDHPDGWVSRTQLPLFAAFVLCWLAFVAGQLTAWRHARGERRQQLKWLIAGAAVCLASTAASIGLGGAHGSAKVLSDVLAVGIIALPAGIGVGILKYRLYDIDRIISRTLAYGIVTGLLVGVYTGLVLLATQVIKVHTPVAVAISTLAAAALFSPLRRRVQLAVDRRFNRARYDADQAVAAFADRLKEAVDLDSVRDDLAGVVQHALEPAHLSVWISRR